MVIYALVRRNNELSARRDDTRRDAPPRYVRSASSCEPGFSLWDCAASIQGQLLLRSALGLCSLYSTAATITLSFGIVRCLFKGSYYNAQLWDCAAPIQGRPLLRSAVGLCGGYSRAATITLSSRIVWRLFKDSYYLICSALGLCGGYSRAATITLSSGIVRRLFKDSYYYAQL